MPGSESPPDPEVVLQQTLRALAGGTGPDGRTDAGSETPGPRGSDRRWLLLIAVLALITGMVLGVGSLWVF